MNQTYKKAYITIGSKIKIMRERSGIKQNFIAEKVGITPQFLSAIENERRMPSMDTVNAIAEFFEICTEEFLNNVYIEKMGWLWIPMPEYIPEIKKPKRILVLDPMDIHTKHSS